MIRLAQEVLRQGYKVVLTGEGADEGLAGYLWFKIQKGFGIAGRAFGNAPLKVLRQAYMGSKKTGKRPIPPFRGVRGVRPAQQDVYEIVCRSRGSLYNCEIPKDKRVVSAVREIVADHAEDQGRHSAYFSQFFGLLWPQLTEAQRAEVGPLLPHFILAFHRPDEDAIRASLRRLPLGDDEIERVISDTYPRDAVLANARDAATVTLRLMENKGVLDDSRIGDEFRSCGLM